MDHQHLLQELGLIIGLGIAAQWVGWKLRFPVIILLLTSGIVAGPVLGLIHPREIFGDLLIPFIELTVAVILFEGGMSLRLHEFREAGRSLLRLFSLAVVFHAVLGTLAGIYIAGLPWQISLLISSILVVTGPTVIMPALREAKLKKSSAHYLKWEGIINDPIGAMFAVLVFNFVLQGHNEISQIMVDMLRVLVVSLLLSSISGYLVHRASVHALIPQFLKVPLIISLVLLLYILSERLQQGSGLLTATLMGLILGNSQEKIVEELRRFDEIFVVFAVSAIFIILAATLEIARWSELDLRHYLFIFLLAFVLRPIAILLSTVHSTIPRKERILIGLYGPRGIVAASIAGVVGAGLVQANHPAGQYVMPVVFSVIIATVILHSLWLKPLSRFLGLKIDAQNGVLIVGASGWSIELAQKLQELELPVLISDFSWYKLARARQMGIPVHPGKIINDIEYGEPDLAALDYLLALTDDDAYNSLLVTKLEQEFGSDHVYRLPAHEESVSGQTDNVSSELAENGDKDQMLFERMTEKYHRGWKFKAVSLTPEFQYEDFLREQRPGESLVFLLLRNNGRIQLFTMHDLHAPEPGDKIIYYSPEETRQG